MRTLRVNEHTAGSVGGGRFEGYQIVLPQRMDFDTNYEETIGHLGAIRQAWRSGFRIRQLWFGDLQWISPAAALVLASEIDRWKSRVPSRVRADHQSWSDDIKRLLCEMGFFELLKLPRPKTHLNIGPLTFLNFRRGESGAGEVPKQLRIDIENLVGQTIRKTVLFEGLSEAITNVGQHAYPDSKGRRDDKHWWLSASFDRETRVLNVIFYDQGAGIPATLPRAYFWEGIKGMVAKWTHSQKIEAAMEYGRSSVDRPERGKGLKNLLEFAKAYPGGKLSIFSLRGLYQVVHTGHDRFTTRRVDHKGSIGGTLLEWSVKL